MQQEALVQALMSDDAGAAEPDNAGKYIDSAVHDDEEAAVALAKEEEIVHLQAPQGGMADPYTLV